MHIGEATVSPLRAPSVTRRLRQAPTTRAGRLWSGLPLAFGLAALLPSAPAAQTDVPKTVNVIVINFDPVLKTRNNLRLHEYMKWSDPWKLTDKMVEDARAASGGYVDYRVVEKIDYDGFTTFRDGFTYTEEAFLHMWEKDRKPGQPRA